MKVIADFWLSIVWPDKGRSKWIGMSRKKKYSPKTFESAGRTNDTSANIYDSMLISEAFKDLNARQRMLYVYCKNQYYGKRKPQADYPDIDAVQGDECFYMNHALITDVYGLYPKTNHRDFYRDMQKLAENGFIEIISSGYTAKKRSIYRFSEKWLSWRPP